MRTAFHDVAMVHDQNHVRIADGGQTVRDHERRTVHGQRVHGLLNQLFRTRIDRRGGLVENQNRRILNHGSRNGEQLLLTLRKRGLVVKHCVIAIRQRHDVVVQPHGLACVLDLLVGDVRLRIRDVFTHCSMEHPRILQYHGELVMHVPAWHGLRIHTINRNRTARNLIETHQQIHHRGLAGTGRTNNRNLLTGLHRSGEIVDDRLARIVTELHMTELNVTAHRFAVHAEQRLLVGFVGHLRLFKEAEHALGSGRATLQVLECLRELGKRLGEQSNVHHERNDHTKLDLAIHRKHSANHAHNHVAEIADEIHQRHHQAGKELALPSRIVQIAVVLFERANRISLAAIRLDHGVAGVHLFDVTVDIAQCDLLTGEVLLRNLHDCAHDEQANQAGSDGAHRHNHIVVEHHDERAHEQRDRRDQRADRLAERLADGVHIVGDAAEHIAVADLVEIPERQLVDLHADGFAQLLCGALRDVRHHPALHVAQHRVPHIQRHQQPCDVRDRVHVDRTEHRLAID